VCGIAGIVNFDRPATASATTLSAMRARLRHRGPDGEGEVFLKHAALTATRLAMVDPSRGAQPLSSRDGRFTLVYNGELYNHDALRGVLPGPWHSTCDTETVLAAWEAWGEDCVTRLDGMFAFFVWDERLQRGYAARDRLGVKPLALHVSNGALAFASEAAALLPVLTGAPRVDVQAVIETLVAPAMSGVVRSPFEGIHYLPPGHTARFDVDGLTVQPYFQWRFNPDHDASDDEHAARLADALEHAVAGALRSDVPLGVFLSGGLDSSAIAAFARGVCPRAWTVTFDGEHNWDGRSSIVVGCDTPHAREVARELDLVWREVRFDRARLPAALRELAATNDALPAWEQELSQQALARAAAREVKGVLVGDAADETHFGYHFLLDEVATSGPEAIIRRLGSVPIRRDVDPDPVQRYGQIYRELIADAGGSYANNPVEATTHLIVRRWLPRLLHNGDIHTMRYGLEARVPFASTRLLDVAATVPVVSGLAHGVEKSALRRALRGVVPESIRRRRKSALPKEQDVASTYQAELSQIMREPHPVVNRIVDLEALRPHLTGDLTESERAQLFRVICLHHWAVAFEVRAP
jgi:asparagine synthase (glutamine-hydrolysing)